MPDVALKCPSHSFTCSGRRQNVVSMPLSERFYCDLFDGRALTYSNLIYSYIVRVPERERAFQCAFGRVLKTHHTKFCALFSVGLHENGQEQGLWTRSRAFFIMLFLVLFNLHLRWFASMLPATQEEEQISACNSAHPAIMAGCVYFFRYCLFLLKLDVDQTILLCVVSGMLWFWFISASPFSAILNAAQKKRAE